MRSINDAERIFSGAELLYNWCQDLEMELRNAGIYDISFYKKRIEYCTEFCSFFPETDSLIIQNMKRAVVECYFAVGDSSRGNEAFKNLIEEYLLMFSCKTRGFCPSSHSKRREEWGEWMRAELLLDVPHRQVVFTVPKMKFYQSYSTILQQEY